MPLEIEWKFLVTKLPSVPDVEGTPIEQGYLDADARPSVRSRVKGDEGWLNIKASAEDDPDADSPKVCHEFDYEIPVDDARDLLELARCRIRKTRYVLPSGLELDVFHGEHEGLVVAEMEVDQGDPAPDPPDGWEWRDVSNDDRYSNRWMAEHGIPDDAELAL